MNITKQFTRYVSQNIFGMLGISCYIIADTFFIAMAAGTNGITVLNLVLPVYNLIFAIGSMIGVGAAIRFALMKVKKEPEADYYFSNAVFFVCIISSVFILAGIFSPDLILKVMGADPQIVEL
ncbi:MAG: MATE family efflux transporter, partial [Lachnospiraceae bacterium]|nr:MATE family efflux transporter [Lachnospiraceae bacterium]